jgi:DNA-binding response OmpR family regulator
MNAPAPTPVDGKFCILLIEEDLTVAEIVRNALQGAGQEVDWQRSSTAGLERFRKSNHHLVLLDIQLHGMNGRDLCCQIRELSAVPIIIITALDGAEDQVLGFKIGADDYLIKPLDARHLVLRVVATLRRVYRYDRLPHTQVISNTHAPTTVIPNGCKTVTRQPSSTATNSTPHTTSLRDALAKSGVVEAPEHTSAGLPSGWGGCESCGYMGPEFKFKKTTASGIHSTECPVCESNLIAFTID